MPQKSTSWPGISRKSLTVGPARHHAPEDAPHEIGTAIADWIDRHQLSDPGVIALSRPPDRLAGC
jgi:hypothetical protein